MPFDDDSAVNCRECIGVAFRECAVLSRHSRRHLRQSPGPDRKGSTHVDTAFMGLTSSIGVTANCKLSARSSSLQPFSPPLITTPDRP